MICMVCVLGACSRIRSIELPPLPTPSTETPPATADPFSPAMPAPAQPEMQTPVPVPTVFSVPSPAPTPVPTPEPTPVPTPTPYVEDPNIPHLFIEGETLPQSMGQYGVAELYGNIYTDKGVIAMVWGRIVDADGVVVQNCKVPSMRSCTLPCWSPDIMPMWSAPSRKTIPIPAEKRC